MNIIFGSKRLGKVDGSHESYQKYPGVPVVTLEGDRGKGRTRRVLFNRTAMELLNLERGDVQQIVFGTIDADDNGNRAIIIANVNNLANIDDLTTYKTSKNVVAYENSKEKGKAISSAALTKQMISFLDLDEDTECEYRLDGFDTNGTIGADTFKFVSVEEEKPCCGDEDCTDENCTAHDTVQDTAEDEDWNSPEAVEEEGFLTRAEAGPVAE